MSVLFYLQGSRPSDISSDTKYESPLDPCPDSPNCIHISREYELKAEKLFQHTLDAIESMNPFEVESDSQNFQIESVFRIRIFGFKDDLKAVIQPHAGNSILFIKSSSRVGHSDLGVNRRRVKKLLNQLEENMNQ